MTGVKVCQGHRVGEGRRCSSRQHINYIPLFLRVWTLTLNFRIINSQISKFELGALCTQGGLVSLNRCPGGPERTARPTDHRRGGGTKSLNCIQWYKRNDHQSLQEPPFGEFHVNMSSNYRDISPWISLDQSVPCCSGAQSTTYL